MENLAGDVEEGIDEDVAKSLEDASSVDAGTIDVATSVATATIDGTEEPAVMGLLLHEQSEAENGEEHCLDVELAISADVDSATIAGIQSSRLDSGPPTVVVTSHMGESNITVVDEKSGLHSMDQDADGSDQEVEQDMSMEDDSQPETVLESGRSESGAEGYSENVQPVLELMSTGTTLVSGSHLMQAVSLPDIQGLQTVTLADGTTVLVQQSQVKGVKQDQNMQLEEGVTAIVQEVPEDSKANITKMLEGQTIELEDGTTAFIQADPKITDSLQAVQLEDGTTAYLSGFMNSDRILDNSNLNVEQLNAQVHQAIAGHSVHVSSGQLYLKTTGSSVKTSAGSTISALPSSPRVPSDRALSLGDKAYRCQYEGCGRLYTTQHHLKVHERYHTGDRPYKCDFGDCEKAFATGYGLKSHTRVHTGEKPYKCPEDTCLKSFKTSGDLQKHIRTHTGERPFKCPFEGCDRSFTTSNIRKVHIRTHTGERPYVCTEAGCNKTFASATNFKNHARIHTGEKPYVCTVQGCGKRFTEYSSLYKHHVVHTHSKPYECCTCGKTYRQTSTLAMHKRTTHGEDVSAEMEAALVMPADVTESGDGDHAKHSGLGLPGHDENEGTLIINTSTGQQMNLVNAAGVGMAADAQTVAAIQHAAQHGIQGTLPPGQPGILAEVGGHQIFVVTDPMILEPLQQIAQNQTGQNVEIIPTVQDVPVDTMINNRQ